MSGPLGDEACVRTGPELLQLGQLKRAERRCANSPLPATKIGASMHSNPSADCVNPQTIPTTTIDLDAIRARAAAALKGPWRWYGHMENKSIWLMASSGPTMMRGQYVAMDFVRWGTQNAQPRFLNADGLLDKASEMPIFQVCPEATSMDDERVYRGTLVGIRNPVADFIAHARQDVDDLLALVDALQAQLAAKDGAE